MPSKIWNKYKIIKEIEDNSNIKTYLTKLEPIVKEIKPKNKEDYFIIMERLERLKLKEEVNIYEIIEEDDKIYIVIDNNDELLSKIDKLILSDELDVRKECIIKDHGRPIKKDEIFNLFKMEKSMCKISFENMRGQECHGSGFFCEIDINFPIKYALFTNNHVLNESNIEIGKTIHFECLEFQKSLFNSSYNIVKKEIKITDKRKVFTNKELDYTCIELFESDGILDYFKIDSNIFKYDLKDNDIFILQFPNGNDLSFSYGSILSLKDNIILHNASTDEGSSGSPIIRRSKENNIIGLHYGGIKNQYNLATCFNSIIDNIKEQNNEINCIYIIDKNKTEINLLYDYNLDIKYSDESDEIWKKIYLNAKNCILEMKESIEMYVNDKKIKFDFKYKIKESKELKELKVKFKFKKLLSNTSYMFYGCSSLKSIDLSSFNTTNVKDMRCMFYGCSSLKSIDLSSFNTTNVKDMSYMFYQCSSLKSIYLSSFNTNNVKDMSYMFYQCSSLNSIDLSSFNTTNVNNMIYMFSKCSSLNSIDLSSFNTTNVNNMSYMFYQCSSLNSINLSSFNTTNVNNLNGMFSGCSFLNSIDLSSFNATNVKDMSEMFWGCSSLNFVDLSSFNKTDFNRIKNLFIFDECTSLKKENIKIKNKNDTILDELGFENI